MQPVLIFEDWSPWGVFHLAKIVGLKAYNSW